MCRDLSGCGSSCSGICGGTPGAVPYQLQADVTTFATAPVGGGFFISEGTGLFPYFSPTVPFAAYLSSLTLTPPPGVLALKINMPTGINNAVEIENVNGADTNLFMTNPNGSGTLKLLSDGRSNLEGSGDLSVINTSTTFYPSTDSTKIISGGDNTNMLELLKTTDNESTLFLSNAVGNYTATVSAGSGDTVTTASANKIDIVTSNNSLNAVNNTLNVTTTNQLFAATDNVTATNQTYVTSQDMIHSASGAQTLTSEDVFTITSNTNHVNITAGQQIHSICEDAHTITSNNDNVNITAGIDVDVTADAGALTLTAATTGLITTGTGTTITSGNGSGVKLIPNLSNYGCQVDMDSSSAEIGFISQRTSSVKNILFLQNTLGVSTFGQGAGPGFTEIASNHKVQISAGDATKLQIVGYGAGNLVSDASGDITVSGVSAGAPPTFNQANGPGTGLFSAVPTAKYHKVTIVGAGGGGGGRNSVASGAGGGGGAGSVVYIQGNTEFTWDLGAGGGGGAAGFNAGSGGASSFLYPTSGTGSLEVGGGGGGGGSNITDAGNPGQGGTVTWTTWTNGAVIHLTPAGNQNGGDGDFGFANIGPSGCNGGGTIICPAGGAFYNGGSTPAAIGTGRGGGGGGGNDGSGQDAGSGYIEIVTYY